MQLYRERKRKEDELLTLKQLCRREYYQNNKEREGVVRRKWREANAEHLKEFYIQYREKNKEKIREWKKNFMRRKRAENPNYAKECHLKYKPQTQRRVKIRLFALKREVMDAYGGVCACCGEKSLEFLALDHINNDGKQHRKELGNLVGSPFYRYLKKNGFPKGRLQVLCYNCNGAKAYYGTCPHQRKE